MNSSVISLLILGGIAVFLIIKLRNVLGTRDGFEGPLRKVADDPQPQTRDLRVIKGGIGADIADYFKSDSSDAAALRRMHDIEPSFDLDGFLKGARSAYEMILIAFENGEVERVKRFLAPEVYEGFAEVAKDRDLRGLKVDANFVGLKELTPQSAEFDETTREGELTVRFVGELTRVVKNRAGAIIEGHATDVIRQRDVWTFARVFGSGDPNWQLVATGE